MPYLKLIVAYDGTNYVGWQFQINGLSIQECLENAWRRLTGETRRITSSGRTDSGVHAEGQVCSLNTESSLSAATIVRGLNSFLPNDIVVLNALVMPAEFHAIRDAVDKTYRYRIQSGPVRNVFGLREWWYVPPRMDVESMKIAAEQLIGRHDFAAFQTTGSERQSTVRTISQIRIETWVQEPFQWIEIFVTADGFLYNMVRCMAGTLANVGKGKNDPNWVKRVLASCDRSMAGATAPPQGLCLMQVSY